MDAVLMTFEQTLAFCGSFQQSGLTTSAGAQPYPYTWSNTDVTINLNANTIMSVPVLNPGPFTWCLCYEM